MEQGVATFLLTQGVLGVGVLVLSGVVAYLFKQNEKLNQTIVSKLEECNQEKIGMYLNEIECQQKQSDAMRQMTHSIDLLAEKINRGAGK